MKGGSHISLIFPGQGAQFVGMGRDIYNTFPAARDIFELADESLGFSLTRLCFEGPEEELKQTINVQPAIVTLSLALLAVMQASARPIEASFTAGHSLGEYSSLSAAGTIRVSDTIILAHRRGELMHEAGKENPGTMAAIIGLDEKSIQMVCRKTGVFIANYNSPGQIVISGSNPNVEAASKMATEKGARKVVPLQVSGAFHTPLMTHAIEGLASAIDEVEWKKPAIPVFANTTAKPLYSVASIKKELIDQLTNPVKWQQSVIAMIDDGVDTFIEIGPSKILTGLIKRINPVARIINISDVLSLRDYIEKGTAL